MWQRGSPSTSSRGRNSGSGWMPSVIDRQAALALARIVEAWTSPGVAHDSLPYRPWDWLSGPGSNDGLPGCVELPRKLRNARPAFQPLLDLLAGLRFKRGAAA